MRKAIVSSCLILAALLALLGCASEPEALGPDDCLVIVKSDYVNNPLLTDEQQNMRYYQFELSTEGKKVTIRKDYTRLVVSEPAVGITAMLSGVQPPATGPMSRDKLDITLPYKPGQIVVADFVFVKKTEQNSSMMFYSSWSLRKITDQERADLLQQFRDKSEQSSDK